jgi:hypothetical protein
VRHHSPDADVTDEMPAEALAPVVAAGDYRRSLEALRDRLAAGIDGASSRQLIHLAPLAKQLADIMRVLDEMPDEDAPADSVETAQEDVQRFLRAVQ